MTDAALGRDAFRVERLAQRLRTTLRRRRPERQKGLAMKFIVEPQKEEKQTKSCRLDFEHTMCVLCSEDPRWCW
jgi:hypothetical protein